MQCLVSEATTQQEQPKALPLDELRLTSPCQTKHPWKYLGFDQRLLETKSDSCAASLVTIQQKGDLGFLTASMQIVSISCAGAGFASHETQCALCVQASLSFHQALYFIQDCT